MSSPWMLSNKFLCRSYDAFSNCIAIEACLFHSQDDRAHNRRAVQADQPCFWTMLEDKFAHWPHDQLASLEDTARLDDFHVLVLHVDLARHRDCQPAELLARPLHHLACRTVSFTCGVYNFHRQIGEQMVLAIRKSFHQIHFILCTESLDIDPRQGGWRDAFDPGMVNHLESARCDLVGTPKFAERDTVADNPSLRAISVAPTAIVG